MKQVNIYTDGSSLNNPGPSGWCALLEYRDANNKLYTKELKGGEAHSTNNRMELKAVIEGLKVLNEPCKVLLHSDSKYVVDSIKLYLQGWIKKNFKEIKNVDLWKEYIEESKRHEVMMVWVKAHAGHPQNEHCDKVARFEASKFLNSKDDPGLL
ncbi:ribonuclease HI [Helicobacter sp. 13S00401-1]|uniref:ribonuclease HI n=1 Tax=Helicobacter sp. 13S00401-1 TaxID=1905758 RepID=UPI000BA7DBEF|nr:ribonuclease HI [Helicobacter sp. 13S00401-1]PAF50273.1 ribonuclease HI [Helicobacter sp. 13S00401-1]